MTRMKLRTKLGTATPRNCPLFKWIESRRRNTRKRPTLRKLTWTNSICSKSVSILCIYTRPFTYTCAPIPSSYHHHSSPSECIPAINRACIFGNVLVWRAHCERIRWQPWWKASDANDLLQLNLIFSLSVLALCVPFAFVFSVNRLAPFGSLLDVPFFSVSHHWQNDPLLFAEHNDYGTHTLSLSHTHTVTNV